MRSRKIASCLTVVAILATTTPAFAAPAKASAPPGLVRQIWDEIWTVPDPWRALCSLALMAVIGLLAKPYTRRTGHALLLSLVALPATVLFHRRWPEWYWSLALLLPALAGAAYLLRQEFAGMLKKLPRNDAKPADSKPNDHGPGHGHGATTAHDPHKPHGDHGQAETCPRCQAAWKPGKRACTKCGLVKGTANKKRRV